MKKILITFCVFCVFQITANAKIKVLDNTLSPDGKLAIACESSEEHGDACYFIDFKTKRKIRGIIEDVSNISILANWNKDGSKVVLLVNYGAKMSAISIYSRNPNGKFDLVEFKTPNPLLNYSNYKSKKEKAAIESASGADESLIGSWIDLNSINLLTGMAKDVDDDANTAQRHFYTSFVVEINQGKGVVKILKNSGMLLDKEANKFMESWEKDFGMKK